MASRLPQDAAYRELLLAALHECRGYRPQFGGEHEEGVTLDHFKVLYGRDPLYHWIGLDSDVMYAAHKAAGGMTSVYRQLGIGCERLLRQIIQDALAIGQEAVAWSYEYEKEGGGVGIHALDARIDLTDVRDPASRSRLASWIARASSLLAIPKKRARSLRGAVFEVRQGYKSADSKRQNADLRFGTRAYNEDYLPVVAVVSTQVSVPVCRRYRAAQLLVLLGRTDGEDTVSTFEFFRCVLGYDLAAFFERNSRTLRAEFAGVVSDLLRP